MARGIKLADGSIVLATVCLMGAPAVLGDRLNHTVGVVFFWAGLIGLVIFVSWKVARGFREEEDALPVNTGAYAGRDNMGTQQVFHGPVTFGVPPTSATQSGTKEAIKGVPDWPIRNLFFRLKPGLQQTKSKTDFDVLANEITDKLATGQLIAWGRAIDSSRTLPLYPIPEDYWLHARLNVWLLDDEPGGGNILQASPVDQSAPNKTQYREILINQAQAVAEWPEEASAAPVAKRHGYDTPLSRAHAYLADLWELEHGNFQVWDALRSAARAGEITIWGRPGGNGLNPDHFYKPPEPIDPIHWREFGFDTMRCLYSNDPRQCRTQPDGGRNSLRWDETYADLKINLAEIKARWS
jgi:hypothetical protein